MGFRHESAAAWWSLLPWPLLLACATASPAPTSPEAAPDRQYPVEAFGAALRATVAAEAPTTFTASPRPELSIPIGAKKPVTCQLHRGTLSLSQYLRGVATLLERYTVTARAASVETQGARLVLSVELGYAGASGLLGILRATVATGSAGSLACSLVDAETDGRHGAAYSQAMSTLLKSATDFSEQPARFTEVWRGAGAGPGKPVSTGVAPSHALLLPRDLPPRPP